VTLKITAEFKYLGTAPTNQNCIQAEQSRDTFDTLQFRSFYLPVSSLKTKITTYKTVILPFVLHECATCTLSQRDEQRLRLFSEQGAEENIWTYEGGSGRRLEETA
jgi:hypothetical protein